MDELECAKEWLVFAERDLVSAEFLLKQKPLPLEIICFLCQQSAEKALKGFLALKKEKPPKIHDLIELGRLSAAAGLEIASLSACFDVLHNYSVQPRYPHELIIGQEDVFEAIKKAQEVLTFIKPLIK